MDRSKSPRAWYLTLQIEVSPDVLDPDTRKQPIGCRLVLARPSQEIKSWIDGGQSVGDANQLTVDIYWYKWIRGLRRRAERCNPKANDS